MVTVIETDQDVKRLDILAEFSIEVMRATKDKSLNPFNTIQRVQAAMQKADKDIKNLYEQGVNE